MNEFNDILRRYGGHMNRMETWKAAASAVLRQKASRLIETGCFRGTESDGYSTVILAALARAINGRLVSYELELRNIEVARMAVRQHNLSDFVQFVPGDSITNLALRKEPVDFAYLDSYDCGPGPDYNPCKKHQLAELEAILPLLSRRAAVLMDDNIDSNCNKVDMALKRLLQRGFRQTATGHQVLCDSDDAGMLPKSKFAVLCGHLDSFIPMAVRTIYRNKAQYCLRHGYDLRVLRSCGTYSDPRSHANGFSWARMAEMLRLVESGKYEWVWCVGGDTLITNMALPLTRITDLAETQETERLPLPSCPPFLDSPAPAGILKWQKPVGHIDYGRKHLLVCGERVTPMQADSFLVRGSPEGAAYLRDILGYHPTYRHHPWVENQAMIDLRDKHAAITCMIPMWMMNAVDFSQWYKDRDEYRDGTDCFGNRGQWIKGDFLLHWPGSIMEDRLRWLGIYEPKVVE